MNKSTQDLMFSSKTGKWATPQDFFSKLDWMMGPFDLDPCSSEDNAKCAKYFTESDDGLAQDWGGHTVFVNPPYDNMKGWARKCYEESLKPDTTVVLLCPARTDTKYFHNYILKASEIYFVKGRLKFGSAQNCAPFPSMVAVFNSANRQQIVGAMNR